MSTQAKGIFISVESESQLTALQSILDAEKVSYTPIGEARTTIKQLPRLPTGQVNPVFIANGKTYTILSLSQGLGVERFTILNKLFVPFWKGFTSFEAIQKYWQDFIAQIYQQKTLAESQYTSMSYAKSFIDQLGEYSNDPNHICFYICSLFFILEGEDLTTWSQVEADLKIEDWKKEGYSGFDFFLIASSLQREFLSALEAKEEQERREKSIRLEAMTTS